MFEIFELVDICEKYIGTDEEVYEMSVGIPYELVHRTIRYNFHLAEGVYKYLFQGHAAQCIPVYDGEARIHILQR